ncbi:hypothetical protein [Priestia aryabhattai]
MKKIKILFVLMSLIVVVAGCSSLHQKNDLDDIEVKPFTTVDDLGDSYGIYYGFAVENKRPNGTYLSVDVTPKDTELKKVIGNKVSTTDVAGASAEYIDSGNDTTLGITVAVPKEKFTKKELEKKVKDFSFSISNGEIEKKYE